MKKSLSVLLSVLIIMSVMSCCFGVSASAADDVIAFRYDALGFAADENGLAANIDFGKNIIRGFDVGVEGYGDYITAGKEGLYPLFETGSAIGTGDRVKVTTEQGNAETAVADYETVVYGDLDGDGYLDVLDAVLVERVSTGAYVPAESDFADGGMSYAAFVEAADVNCDGQINEFDYSALVDAALGGAKIDQHRVRASWVEDIHSEIEAQAFTGLEITPDFDVDLCGKLLDADSDYDVTFSKNIEIGEAYITVSAKKDSLYSGEKTFTFEIKSIIEIVCREIGKMLEKCGINDCISVNYNDETSVVDVIFDGDVLLALELNPDREALTDIYSELMSLFGKVYAERKLTVGGVAVGENGVKNYAGINEIKNELRNALREFENAEENLVKSFDGVIASETVNENFKVNVKFDCSDADVLYGGLAALDGFVAFGKDEAEPEFTVIDVNIPVAYARELAAEYDDIYSAVEDFGEMNVNSFIGKFAELQTSDITAENGSVINMFTDAFGKMNILVTDILAERDIRISADGSEYINAYNGNAFNSENGSTADIGSFIAALGELADLESVNASAFDNGRGDYCAYVKVGYADSEYVKNYKLNINVFGTLVDELENTACDYTALTNAINNANTVLAGGTVYTSASLEVVNEKLAAANGVPAGLLKGVNCENQKLIDNAANELNLAVAALINKADYTKLNEAKSAAAVIKADGKDYTDDTMAVLDNALSDANGLSADLSFEYQQTVDAAAKAINDAIAALKINADYTALNEAKADAAEIKANGKVYTNATMSVLDSALTAAEGVPAGLTIESQQTINDAAAAINTAIEGLKEKADYSALETAKADAAIKKADGNDYTDDTMAVLDSALDAADKISDDLSVECQQTVTNAANAINNAIAALKIKADYTELNAAKEAAAAKKSDPKIYTDATLLVLETALNAAAEIPENLTSESQQLIDEAAAAINNAIAALEEKADYTQLDVAKQAAANVNFATYIVYTEESLAAFNTALENANALSTDLSVDYQQVIDDAAAALNDAITSLKIKADYIALNEAKAAAAEIKANGKVYTNATMSALDAALADADKVPENLTSESQQLIDDAAAAVNNAITALKEKANYSVLESAVQLAAGIKTNGNDYFEDTMAVLDSALEAAGEIFDDLSVDDQQIIDDAESAILNAIAALKIKADYTALNEAKTAAAEKKNDGKVYTTATMSVLDSALTAAEGVPAGLTSESQQLIDDAAAAINNAIAALVEYVDPTEVNNIAVKLANTSKYLYRIGNANAVALSYLFEAKGEVNSADVVLTVTTVEGTAACTYTANTTAWQNGTVKFSGEGVVKLSIKHTKAPATELYLEVVNGKNFTSASGLNATSANAVLLSDITHTGNFSVSNGYTLYGNGFTVNGSFHKNSSSLLCGFVTLNNGTLDNVVIRHAVYPEQNLYRDSASKDGAYFNYVVSAVYVEGSGGKIVNSFISGGRAAVYVVGSKVEITDSTLYGGSVANIHADGENTVVLTNVTTVQVPMIACDGSRSVKGLGVVLGQYAMGTKIVLNGYLKQYNWITADDEQYIVDTQMMGSVLNAALSSDFARTVGGKKYANAGIVGMFEDALLITDNRTNTDVTYEYKQITVRVSIASMTGGSYNIVSGGDPLAEIPEYEATAQSVIAPAVKYQSSQNVEMSGDSLNIPVAAKVMKYGTEIPYEVYYNGQKVTGDSITVTNKGDYTLTYKYADSMIYGAGGVRTGESFNYSTDVTVKVTKAATKTITMTYDKTNAVYYWVKAGTAWDPDWSSAVPLLEGLVIKSEDEQGNVVEIFNGAGMGRIPDNLGLEITSVSGFISGATATQVSYNGQMYAYGTGKFDNNKTAHNITVKYKYTDEYNKEHTLSVTWNITASTTGTEVSESKFKDSGTQKYVALFEACGGYCATGFAAVTSGTNITLPSATREGYKFNGWYSAETGGTKLGDAGATYKMSAADVTFYAHWVASRTLTFNACGGTYSVTTAKYFDGDTVTLAKPEYSGFYFMGWCESEGGNGERYTSKFVMPDKDVTLYAIWSETPPAEFTVKFDVNGGPGSVAQMIAKDGEDLVLPAAPAREGYTFNGWFTAASGGTRIGGAGDEVKFTENTDLFAQWSVNSYNVTTSTDSATITLTANGQSVSSGASVAYGTVLKVELSYGGTGNRTFTVTGAAYYSDEACLNATTSTEPGTYYIKMPANNITLSASSSCFATGTLITLADGSQKKIEDITFGDKILAWDFFTGSYAEKEISLLVYHGDDEYTVVNTVYSDGTVLRTIGEHGVFDYDLNKFVYITAENCTDYIGHRFVKYVSKDAYEIVTMVDAYTETEVTGSYSISSAGTSNAIAEGLLTVAPPEDFYNWIEMDGKLHYDVEQFNADVEKYGLYDYEVFSDYVSYEQFVAFNGAYLKIPVEKGLFTFDYIIELINLYSTWMPE